jgi:hypothetical protein
VINQRAAGLWYYYLKRGGLRCVAELLGWSVVKKRYTLRTGPKGDEDLITTRPCAHDVSPSPEHRPHGRGRGERRIGRHGPAGWRISNSTTVCVYVVEKCLCILLQRKDVLNEPFTVTQTRPKYATICVFMDAVWSC